MKPLLTTTLLLLLVSFFSGGVSGQDESALSETLSIDRLSWLTGNWKGPRDGGVLEETWLPPLAGTITALVRSSKDQDTRFVEIVHIREINGSLELNLQLFNNSLEPENINVNFFQYLFLNHYRVFDLIIVTRYGVLCLGCNYMHEQSILVCGV